MSRYTIAAREESGEGIVELVDEGAASRARIVPGIGAQCASFTWTHGERELDVLVPPPDIEALRRDPVRFGNPILFPFPGRIKDGVFSFRGRRVVLPINDAVNQTAIHGLVLREAWRVVDHGADAAGAWVTCGLRTADHPELERLFPFPYELRYTYRLREGRLESEIAVRNTGDGPLPMGLGLHPWFPLPLSANGSRGACTLRAPVSRIWELERLVPTGRILLAEPARDLSQGVTLGDQEFDDVYTGLREGVDASGWSRSSYADPAAGVEIAVLADRNFRELVVYAPKSRPVVCLEPYTCAPNAFNLASRGIDGGMTVVEPGGTWSARVVYEARGL